MFDWLLGRGAFVRLLRFVQEDPGRYSIWVHAGPSRLLKK